MTQHLPETCFKSPIGDVLRMSWGLKSTSQGRPLNIRLGHPLEVISGNLQDIRWHTFQPISCKIRGNGSPGSMTKILKNHAFSNPDFWKIHFQLEN